MLVEPGGEGLPGAAAGGSRPDPLVAGPGRIPRQNIPLPEKGGTAGGNKRGDPLLGSPVARPPNSRVTTGATYPLPWLSDP